MNENMTMLKTLKVACSFAPSPSAAPAPMRRRNTNIVFILIDDMPWFGTPVRMDADMPGSAMAFRNMPNVEKLAAQGMTFRNARAAAGMCAPSRCSIMTGMMTARHLYSGNGGFGTKTDGTVKYMSRKEDATLPLLHPEPQGNIRFPSIGDVLKATGYATAHFGKWHLYGGGPAKHGFDESDGETDNKGCQPDCDPATGKKTIPPKIRSSCSASPSAAWISWSGRPRRASPSMCSSRTMPRTRPIKPARPRWRRTRRTRCSRRSKSKRERANAVLCAAMAEDLDTSIGMVLAKAG